MRCGWRPKELSVSWCCDTHGHQPGTHTVLVGYVLDSFAHRFDPTVVLFYETFNRRVSRLLIPAEGFS